MGIQPIKKANVSEQVYEQLKKQLLNGEWKQGDKIPSENELAEAFNVSRITVRHAIQKLTALGLIETRVGEGSFVREVKPGVYMNAIIPLAYLGENSTLEVLEFRYVVESESVGLAAERATQEDIAELKEILKNMEDVKEDAQLFAEADLRFHFKIAQITRNSLIIETYNILNDILETAMNDIVKRLGFEIGIYYHTKLLEAIEHHDSEHAKKIMKEHVNKTIENYRKERLVE
ncbi:FadR/GntR family transcriptional regulator [Mahella australiensis]|uniref:Transcriptional regulator, GntR family n=1 Tax=Mahella australiensis (strain DSM 15567 / CIP 107919 / 50-1 BON) TaxID=697281 RepID=F3ZYU1_MAHA5|nr:FadR/GntR family transcriptional regulator [Mahella australiensis]AEE95686.1 transcriptional regulator, GntR family [Mahella australiensis 50-1 BON]